MTLFPADIDTDVSLPPVIDNVTEISGTVLNGLREAIIAIETALGSDPQGSQNSLADRLDQILNPDGTFKSSALNASGLISLPVENVHIGASAGIEESKLDLDFGTSALQDQISSNDIDIANLQSGLASLLARYNLHVSGTNDRHSATHVDHILSDGYLSGAGATVASALDYISGKLDAHKLATSTIEHFASAIYFDPSQTVSGQPDIVVSNNVQSAIEEVEFAIIDSVRTHNDYAHSDGVLADGYSYFNGLAGVNDASLKLTRYNPPSGTDILKIGLCNAATIKGKGFNPIGITGSFNAFRVEYRYGSLSSNFSVAGLDTSAYPVGNTRRTLLGIVDALNFAAASNNKPLSFFASDDGEIVIQANVALPGFEIRVITSPVNSAYVALGFSEIANTWVGPSDNHHFVINGTIYNEIKTVQQGSGNQPSLSNVVDLGVTVGVGGLDLQANSLLHVYSHTSNLSVGTYKITGLSGLTSVILSSNLAAGDFEYIIYKDTLNTNNITSNRRIIDTFIDSDRNPFVVERATTVFGGLEGVRIVSISKELQDFSGTYTLATSGSQREFYISDGYGNVGVSTFFDPGYIGYLQVWFPDNVNSANIFVFSVSPTNGTDTIEVIENEVSDSALYLGSSHHNGLTEIEIPFNSRSIGSIGTSQLSSDFYNNKYNKDINNFHLSGIIRGFDVISFTSSSLNIRGGTAYISGKETVIGSVTITLPVASLSDGIYNVVLDNQGVINYFVDDDSASSSSYSVADILRHDYLILICQFRIVSNAIASTTDCRFFINDIESRLQLTVDDRELGAGSFRSLDAAVLYSQNAPNNTKPEITVLSDLSISGNLEINSGDRIVCFGDINVSGNLTVDSGGELIVYGSANVSGTSSLASGSSAQFLGGGVLSGAMSLSSDTALRVSQTLTCSTISCSGTSIAIRGSDVSGNKPSILFDGTSDGLTGTVSGLAITNISFVMTVSTYDIADIALSDFFIEGCTFEQSSALTNAQLAVLTRCGVYIEGNNGRIANCTFYNLGAGIRIKTGSNDIFITNCYFDTIGTAVEGVGVCDNVLVSGSLITNLHVSGIVVRNNWLIYDNIFNGQLNSFPTSSPAIIYSTSSANNVIVSKNIISDYNAYETIDLNGSSDYAVIASNLWTECISNRGHLIRANNNSVISHNLMSLCSGPILSTGQNSVIANNNFEEVSSSGTYSIVSVSGGSVSGNTILSGNLKSLIFNGCIVSGNFFDVGNIITAVAASQYTGNYMNCSRSGAVYGVRCTHTSGYGVFTNNVLVSAAASTSNSCALSSTSQISVSGNYIISSASANRCVDVRSSFSAINGNIVSSGSAYGVYIDGNKISVQNNIIYGSVSGSDILAASGSQDLIITGNILAGTGGERVGHADSSPTSVYIGMNKGALERRTYSVFSGYRSGTWTYGTSGLTSNTLNDFIIVGLNNLPVGVRLNSINVYCTNSGSTGNGTVQLFHRTTSSATHTSISAETDMVNGYQALSVSPSSTTFVRAGYEYFAKINVKSTSNISVSQIAVNITV
jgi:hypothetical protein